MKDRVGVSWQIVPAEWVDMAADGDPERSARRVRAVLGMTKLDIEAIRRAADG